MSYPRSDETLWVIVESRKQEFAVPASYVREIVAMPTITAVPGCGARYRGVINLRGSVLPLLDMRKNFGWQSVPEELDDFYRLMSQRERDHLNWLKELERSVTEGDEFRLGRDPHKCAFGKWYDTYRSESPWVTALLKEFESPHNRIHALANSIEELTRAGQKEAAMLKIEGARNGVLGEMITLFHQLRDLTRDSVRELAMVIIADGRTFAVSIDRAVGVEKIPADLIREVQTDCASREGQLVHRAAQRKSTGGLAMILEPAFLRAGAA